MGDGGKTTQQMISAPEGALFIWVNGLLDYPKKLALKLGRQDIHIEGPDYLTSNRWRGMQYTDVVIDHAACLTLEQLRSLYWLRFDISTRPAK